MPRQKLTRGTAELAEGLPRLTSKQERYVRARLGGKNNHEAIRIACDTSKWSKESVWREAAKLESHPKIQQWLMSLRAAAVEEGLYGLQEHLQELTALKQAAEEAGNFGAAASCVQAKGKALGLYVERSEVSVTKDADLFALLDQVEALAGPEARGRAARKLGVEDEGSAVRKH